MSGIGWSSACFPDTAITMIKMWIILLIAGSGWGLTVSLATLALSTGYHPIGMSFWSSVLVFLILTGIQIVRRKALPCTRPYAMFCIVCGFLGTALPHVLSFYAAVELEAGIRAAVFALIPLTTLLFAILFKLEKANAKRLMGLGLGGAGMLVLVGPDIGVVKVEDTIWLIMSLGVVISYSLESIYIAKTRPPDIDPLTALWGMTLAALLMLTPITAFVDGGFYISPSWGTAEWSVVMMSCLHVCCYATLIYMIDKAGSVFASQISYVVAPAGVIGGVFILSEQPSLVLALSIILVLAGTFLVKPVKKQSAAIHVSND